MRNDGGGGSAPGQAQAGDTRSQSEATQQTEAQDASRTAARARQREASFGSHSADDPDQPRWENTTKIEAEYPYDGFVLYKGRRADGRKAFLTGRPITGGMGELDLARRDDPNGFYSFPGLTNVMKGKGGAADTLYRQAECLQAMAERPDEFVFICEGEKDVETLIALGLIATTNPNGALNWPSEFNRHFRGSRVAIPVDNDPRGRERARRMLPGLSRYAASVKVIELPGLQANGDVTDWLEEGRSKDDLLAVVEATADSEPGSSAGAGGEHATAPSEDDFARNRDGVILKSPANARLALALMGVSIRFDEFAARYLIDGLAGFGPVLDDAALTRSRLMVEERWSLTFAKERWADILTDHARRNTFHPVLGYLNSLKWDGVARLDNWLATYGGAEPSEYLCSVSAIPLIAAVRRVRQPGCKFDEMPVLESEQGTNKSSALAILAGPDEWFTDDCPLNADSKVMIEQLTGRWIVEMGELKGMRRGDVEHVKSMLSRRVDKARLAYGKLTTEQPRQCVFFGTTNDRAYLRDMTGNRRFWPVTVKRFDLAALRRDRDQLWAEAASREASGEPIRLPEHLWAVAGEFQAAREVMDPFLERLSERLDGLEGKVRAGDIWEAVGLGDEGKRTQDHNVRLSAVMQKLGWRRPPSKLRFDGRPQHAWVKGSPDDGAFEEVPRAVVLGRDDADGRPL